MNMYGLMLDLAVSAVVVGVSIICGLVIIYDLDHPSSVREDRIYTEMLMSKRRMEDMKAMVWIRHRRLKVLIRMEDERSKRRLG